jgi:hypothetical protein
MMQPNWFDKKYNAILQSATARDFLMEIASDERLIKAVEDAMASHDLQKASMKIGASRTQVVRRAIADALQADT